MIVTDTNQKREEQCDIIPHDYLNYVIGSVAILCENTNILRKCRYYAKIRIFYENTDTMRKCEIFYGNADTMRKCEMFYENTDAMRKCKSYTEEVVHAN